MNSKTREDVVFDTAASCAVLVAGTVFAALVYRLITVAAPLLEAMARAQVVRGF
jgi:hypothetical protein